MLNSIFKIWLNEAGTGSPVIEAYRQYSKNATVYLSGLDNWYNDNVSLTTVPKLNGNGTFLTGISKEDKIVRLAFVSSFDNELELRTYVDEFRNHIISQLTTPTLSKLQIVFSEAPGYSPVVRTETLNAYLTTVTDLVEYTDGEDLTFSLEFTATNPDFVVA